MDTSHLLKLLNLRDMNEDKKHSLVKICTEQDRLNKTPVYNM